MDLPILKGKSISMMGKSRWACIEGQIHVYDGQDHLDLPILDMGFASLEHSLGLPILDMDFPPLSIHS